VLPNTRTILPACIRRFSLLHFKILNLSLQIPLLAALGSLVVIATRVGAQTPAAPGAAPPSSSQASPAAPAAGSLAEKVETYLRNMYAWGPQYEVRMGTPRPSPIPDLLEISVTVGFQGQSDTAVVYVNKAGKYIFRGDLADMTVDPLADVRSKLHPGDSPSLGPVDAKITLIEFADFECPSCRQLDRILRELLPRHPEIRLVYKDFPLTTIHPWAMTAAIAGQCAAGQNPASFWQLHDIIFDAQDLITPSNVWDKMTDFASQIGLNADTFRACMSDPRTAAEVDKTTEQGQQLNITATPTVFVNGRRVVGPDEPLLNQSIEFESKHNIPYQK
jgi:protein-disulfide isomerase